MSGVTQSPYSGTQLHCYRHPDKATYIRCQRCGRPICPECMISAAVGFQCPQCVKQGARASRQNRGPFGGQVSANAATTTVVLIGINVVVWLAITITGGVQSWLTNWLSLSLKGSCHLLNQAGYYPSVTADVCAEIYDTGWVPGFSDGAFWQPLTSMFTHEDFMHILFNMLALWFLGPQLERIVGRVRFLALYLLAGLAGSAVVLWLTGAGVSTLGASGSVFGLMGGLLVIAIRVHADIKMILAWLAINVVYTFAYPGISWQGHLGGLLGGLAIAAIMIYVPGIVSSHNRGADRDRIQIAALMAFGVLVVVALVVRVFVS